MSKKVDKILNFFFPERCILCNRAVKGKTAVCSDCSGKLELLSKKKTCKKCSHPVGEGEFLCNSCLTHRHYFTACFAAALYKKDLRYAIINYKFYNRPDLHRGLARLILSRLAEFDALPSFDLIMGVPLSDKKLTKRGYDQAVLLAKVVAEELGMPFADNCIKKVKDTAVQSKLTYAQRQKNLRGAFKVLDKEAIKGKTILLVDDIYTTGATVNEISRILIKAGAKEVYVATVALTELGQHEEDT